MKPNISIIHYFLSLLRKYIAFLIALVFCFSVIGKKSVEGKGRISQEEGPYILRYASGSNTIGLDGGITLNGFKASVLFSHLHSPAFQSRIYVDGELASSYYDQKIKSNGQMQVFKQDQDFERISLSYLLGLALFNNYDNLRINFLLGPVGLYYYVHRPREQIKDFHKFNIGATAGLEVEVAITESVDLYLGAGSAFAFLESPINRLDLYLIGGFRFSF